MEISVIPYESTKVFIRTIEREVAPENEAFWDENQISRTAVCVWAPTIFDVKPSNELYKWVATEGADFFYGHCKVLNYGDDGQVQVIFEITIAGDTIDPGELKQALLAVATTRSEEHTSELQSHHDLVCRLLLEKKKNKK